MNKQTAKALVDEYLKWGECFNRITELTFDLDEEAARAIRRAVADAEIKLYEGLVQPVVKQYPELEPPIDDT
jgi:hypothetical protein